MIKYMLQEFGGRGASLGTGIVDWLTKEAQKGNGTARAQPIDIRKYQGKSLEAIEGRIRRLKHEELFAVNQRGEIIAAYKGRSTSVSFPVSLLEEEGITVTHGHPKGYEEFGGTFSFADIHNMLESKWQEHRATASGQGEMNYIMRRTKQADPQGLRNRINKDYLALKKKSRDAYQKAYQEYREVDEAAEASDSYETFSVAEQDHQRTVGDGAHYFALELSGAASAYPTCGRDFVGMYRCA